MTNEVHDRAVERLQAGRIEQDRLGVRYDAAIGTSTEMSAYHRLRAAGDQVAARETWLNWMNDESYRGLDAGSRTARRELQSQARQVPGRGGSGS